MNGVKRQYMACFLLVLCCLTLSGCGGQKNDQDITDAQVTELIQDTMEFNCITAGTQDGFYMGVFTNEGPCIYAVDADGKKTVVETSLWEDHVFGSITAMLYSEQKDGGAGGLYVALDELTGNGSSQAALYLLDLDTGEYTQQGLYDGYTQISNIMETTYGVYLFLLGTEQAQKQPVPAQAGEIFDYAGEVLIHASGEVVFDAFPTVCVQTKKDELLLYAHEDGEGFYFLPAKAVKTGLDYGEKIWKDLAQITAITMTKENRFLYTSRSFSVNGMMEVSLEDDVERELLSDRGVVMSPADIFYQDGMIYYRTSDGIVRCDYEHSGKENKTLHILQSDTVGMDAPFGCGYRMVTEKKNEEEMALTVLSQEAGYELYCMQSGDSFGWNVREKGSFYPLTDIEEVTEYLNACLPYVKEAATDDDGEIWMLPVAVSSMQLLYDQELLERYGIVWEDTPDLKEFLQDMDNMQAQNGEEFFSVPITMLDLALFQEYANRKESFDTEEFRACAAMLKERHGSETFLWHSAAEESLTRHKQEFVCGLQRGAHTSSSIIENPYVRAGRVPVTEKELPMAVECYFLCINPASDNIEAAVAYLRSLCKYLLEQKDTMMLKDKSLYTDTENADSMYQLYKNAEIIFCVPEDLYDGLWQSYLEDEMSLDDMIAELDRKITMYKKE